LEYLKVDPAAEDEYSIDPREKAKLTVVNKIIFALRIIT